MGEQTGDQKGDKETARPARDSKRVFTVHDSETGTRKTVAVEDGRIVDKPEPAKGAKSLAELEKELGIPPGGWGLLW